MAGAGRNIIVVGTSAGGLDALERLVRGLPTTTPAAIFIVQHLAPELGGEALLKQLGKFKAFQCKLATDGDVFSSGRIYIAPADHHLLIKGRQLLVTKGARENRHRPAIDPLFRSAAVNHGPHVIGVVLTGMLDDGTAGLIAIKRCGGVTVVQDPKEAAYPAMPLSVLANLRVDHCVRLNEMGPLLDRLSREPAGKRKPIPDDVRTEARIAERVLSDVAAVNGLGDLVPYNCPNCGGVLWEVKHNGTTRFRCHTGHSYTAASLVASQTERIEETLWVALRMFEERKNVLNSTSRTGGAAMTERIREAESHIERIRAILLSPGMAGDGEGQPSNAQGRVRSATRKRRTATRSTRRHEQRQS